MTHYNLNIQTKLNLHLIEQKIKSGFKYFNNLFWNIWMNSGYYDFRTRKKNETTLATKFSSYSRDITK